MHILEIIEPRMRTIRSQGPIPPGENNKSKNFIDSGNFSMVHQDDDPHMVKKTARGAKESEIDGYWVFVNYVLKNKLWENPYFPRFYKQDTRVYQGNRKIKDVTMEKLHPLTKISQEEGQFLYRKVFGEEVDKFDYEDFAARIEDEVSYGKFKGNVSNYDSNYASAVKTLHKMASKHNLGVDIWEENLMVRRGRTGVQLVITDPFAHRM